MVKQRVHRILEPAAAGDTASRVFDVFILSLIALNIVALILESVDSIAAQFGHFFYVFEVVSVIIFSAEYLLRVWSCTAADRFRHPILGRLRFAVTPMALVDLWAVLPFYLPLLGMDMRFLRAARLLRLFRLLKIGRYSQALQTMGRVFKSKREELTITAFVVLMLLVVASCLLYFVEHDAQPEAFSSIPATMWWAVATLTTVGYGDIYPVTTLGKTLGATVAILGIGLFALPTGILGAAFIEQVQKRKSKQKCPHCGKDI